MLAIALWRERERVFILETQYNAMQQMFIETHLRSGPEATISLGEARRRSRPPQYSAVNACHSGEHGLLWNHRDGRVQKWKCFNICMMLDASQASSSSALSPSSERSQSPCVVFSQNPDCYPVETGVPSGRLGHVSSRHILAGNISLNKYGSSGKNAVWPD